MKELSPVVKELMARAEAAATQEDALPLVTEALLAQLRDALRASGVRDPDGDVTLLRHAGLDNLLTETLLSGRLTLAAVDRYVTKARTDLRAGDLDVDALKMALVTFDGVLQRYALASDHGQFKYPLRGNPARDLLLGFAYSLHV